MSEEVLRGKVKFFNRNKGYGFIDVPDQEVGIFFHVSDVQGKEYFEQKDPVSFEVDIEGSKGPRAVKIQRIT